MQNKYLTSFKNIELVPPFLIIGPGQRGVLMD